MKIRTLMLGIGLAIATSIATGLVSAEVYKWTDETGKVHYGDRKPEKGVAQRINVSSGKSSSQPSQMAAEPESATPAAEAATAAQRSKDKGLTDDGLTNEQRQANCDVARKNLKTMQDNARIRIQEGEAQRYLTAEEIEEKRAEMQQLAAVNCGNRSNTNTTAAN